MIEEVYCVRWKFKIKLGKIVIIWRMIVNLKSVEDYVCKVNRFYDIYLERELYYLEDERWFYFKNFWNEFRVVKEKCD